MISYLFLLLHPLIFPIEKTVNSSLQSFFSKVYPLTTKFFIICVFSFYNLSVVQAKVRKAKIDKQAVESLNASIDSIDNMELVLKKIFKTQEDYHEINKDLELLTKKGIMKMDLRFEAGGKEIVLKSKRKTVFKFRPLTIGDKVEDFTFNINGQKFFIDPNRSYSYHKRQIENIFGFSRQSLLESLVIRRIHALPPVVVAVASLLVGTAAWIWRATPGFMKWAFSGAGSSATAAFIINDKDGGDGNRCGSSDNCTIAQQDRCYRMCKENELIKSGCADVPKKICAEENCNYCELSLNELHFEDFRSNNGMGDETDDKIRIEQIQKKCVKKMIGHRETPSFMYPCNFKDQRQKQECLAKRKIHLADKAIKICNNRLGYAVLYTTDNPDNNLSFLRNRLSSLIDKGAAQRHGNFFDKEKCMSFTKASVYVHGWGMKEEWARKYCKAAAHIHEGCSSAARKCSSEIKADIPRINSSHGRTPHRNRNRSTSAESSK